MALPPTLLIVNPKSQNGSLSKRWPSLRKQVKQELESFEEQYTQGPGDATTIARQALQNGIKRVIAIGGDGTINEVANGFFSDGTLIAPDACMGILPYGTGGDFRRSVRIPNDLSKAARIIAQGKVKHVDIGQLECLTRNQKPVKRFFVNIASFGNSGEIDEQVNSSSKRLGGKISFFMATIKVGFRFKNKRVRMTFDNDHAGAIETTIITVAIANGAYFGGGMHVAPDAQIDDGKFDVVAMGDMSFGETMWNSRLIYQGRHLRLDKVSSRRAQTLHVESVDGQEVLIDMDGEMPGMLPATFTIVPNILPLLVP